MSRELYFLRSSEQKIVKDMVKFAYPSDTTKLDKFWEYYGLTTKDLGLYALVDNEIAGAVWTRESESGKPIMSFAIVPKFKGKEVGSFMLNQFLQELGAMYEEVTINISHKLKAIAFYEKFGFEKVENTEKLVMKKKLEKKEVIRPTDGYDPTRWMD